MVGVVCACMYGPHEIPGEWTGVLRGVWAWRVLVWRAGVCVCVLETSLPPLFTNPNKNARAHCPLARRASPLVRAHCPLVGDAMAELAIATTCFNILHLPNYNAFEEVE